MNILYTIKFKNDVTKKTRLKGKSKQPQISVLQHEDKKEKKKEHKGTKNISANNTYLKMPPTVQYLVHYR